jgi:hypothetical protein
VSKGLAQGLAVVVTVCTGSTGVAFVFELLLCVDPVEEELVTAGKPAAATGVPVDEADGWVSFELSDPLELQGDLTTTSDTCVAGGGSAGIGTVCTGSARATFTGRRLVTRDSGGVDSVETRSTCPVGSPTGHDGSKLVHAWV